jgi:hypothetical protein
VTVGRLIFPNKVTLGILKPDEIRSNNEYDDEFRELIVTDSDGDGIGEENRRERTVITDAQIATRTLDRFFQAEHGQSPETRDLELTFHFRGLKAAVLHGRPALGLPWNYAQPLGLHVCRAAAVDQ